MLLIRVDASPLLFFLRLRGLGRKFRRGRAVAAVFLRTVLFGAAALSGLEREDGPAALRALLVERLDPHRVLAVRITRARVEDLAVTCFVFVLFFLLVFFVVFLCVCWF